jgi:hypothetical protein
MSIETTLERIAAGIETLVVLAKTQTAAPKLAAIAEASIKTSDKQHAKRGTTPTAPRETPAAPKTAPVVEPPKADVVVVTSDEDLFDEPVAAPAKAVTIEEVRAALKGLKERKGKDVAFATLAAAGGGAKFLPGSTQSETSSADGLLKPEFFAAVLAAAKAA